MFNGTVLLAVILPIICNILIRSVGSAVPSTALPDTNYPIPASGAIFVSPTGNDANSGTSASAPLRNIRTAKDRVPAGGTIVLRGGSYYDVALGFFWKKVTIQAYPHEKPWIKGSVPVTGWIQEGTIWRHNGWTKQFCSNCYIPDVIDPAYPNAGLPDQVFINGIPQVQVTSKVSVTGNKFYVDYPNAVLYVGTDPTGKLVEASTQWMALLFDTGSDGSAVRGVGFAQYAPHFNEDQLAAVISSAASITFESCAFTQSAGTSLGIFAKPGVVVRNCYLGQNGRNGANVNKANGLLFENNIVDDNNLEHFAYIECGCCCTVAGIKICRSDNVIIRNNYFRNNICTGLWFDLGNRWAIVVKNTFIGNKLNGIFYEVSSQAIIASNVIVNNVGAGVEIASSDRVRVYNNDFNRNHYNLGIYDDMRKPDEYSAPLGLTWNTTGTEIVNNLISNTDGNGFFYDSLPGGDVNSAQMLSRMDHNGWYRTSTSAPTILAKWCPPTCVYFATHAQFVSATGGKDAVPPSIVVENTATNPFFVNEAGLDFNLVSVSKAINAGAPLPADIASAIGVASATPVNMGALLWRGKAQSQTLKFIVTDDATIKQGTPTTNYGSDTQVIADADPRTDFLLKFVLSGIGTTRRVTKTVLKLYAVDPGGAGAKIYRTDHNNWLQGTVTWNAAPWIVTPELATLPVIASGVTYSADLTVGVHADGTYSFRVITPSIEGIRFSAKEGTVKPVLEVIVQ